MRIEHIAMYVQDLERAKDFFVCYFGGRADARYYNEKTAFSSYFLRFQDGARLELMHSPRLTDPEKQEARTGYAHLAFATGSREAVDSLTARLAADGYRVISGPRLTGDGYYESCILDAEGNRIEITV